MPARVVGGHADPGVEAGEQRMVDGVPGHLAGAGWAGGDGGVAASLQAGLATMLPAPDRPSSPPAVATARSR